MDHVKISLARLLCATTPAPYLAAAATARQLEAPTIVLDDTEPHTVQPPLSSDDMAVWSDLSNRAVRKGVIPLPGTATQHCRALEADMFAVSHVYCAQVARHAARLAHKVVPPRHRDTSTTCMAMPYRALFFATGAFLQPFETGPRPRGTIATIVLQPSASFSAGALTVRKGHRTAYIELAAVASRSAGVVVLGVDCEFGFLPLTSGSRVCLVFHLVQEGSAGWDLAHPNTANAELGRIATLHHVAGLWARMIRSSILERSREGGHHTAKKLLVPLQNDYGESGPTVQSLDGQDAEMVASLKRSNAFHVGLARLENVQRGEFIMGAGYPYEECDAANTQQIDDLVDYEAWVPDVDRGAVHDFVRLVTEGSDEAAMSAAFELMQSEGAMYWDFELTIESLNSMCYCETLDFEQEVDRICDMIWHYKRGMNGVRSGATRRIMELHTDTTSLVAFEPITEGAGQIHEDLLSANLSDDAVCDHARFFAAQPCREYYSFDRNEADAPLVTHCFTGWALVIWPTEASFDLLCAGSLEHGVDHVEYLAANGEAHTEVVKYVRVFIDHVYAQWSVPYDVLLDLLHLAYSYGLPEDTCRVLRVMLNPEGNYGRDMPSISMPGGRAGRYSPLMSLSSPILTAHGIVNERTVSFVTSILSKCVYSSGVPHSTIFSIGDALVDLVESTTEQSVHQLAALVARLDMFPGQSTSLYQKIIAPIVHEASRTAKRICHSYVSSTQSSDTIAELASQPEVLERAARTDPHIITSITQAYEQLHRNIPSLHVISLLSIRYDALGRCACVGGVLCWSVIWHFVHLHLPKTLTKLEVPYFAEAPIQELWHGLLHAMYRGVPNADSQKAEECAVEMLKHVCEAGPSCGLLEHMTGPLIRARFAAPSRARDILRSAVEKRVAHLAEPPMMEYEWALAGGYDSCTPHIRHFLRGPDRTLMLGGDGTFRDHRHAHYYICGLGILEWPKARDLYSRSRPPYPVLFYRSDKVMGRVGGRGQNVFIELIKVKSNRKKYQNVIDELNVLRLWLEHAKTTSS